MVGELPFCENKYSLMTNDVEETRQVGQKLGAILAENLRSSLPSIAIRSSNSEISRNFVVALHGNLGAGKTTLTQGIAAGLGIDESVTSPTFILINEYETSDGLILLHVDSYRMGDDLMDAQLEAEAIGLLELFETEPAVVVIEWADRVDALLPQDYILVTLASANVEIINQPTGSDNHQVEGIRNINVIANGPHSTEILNLLRKSRQ